ncbi:MAG: iron export ABC transporter permease subunit FetB, partial [Myxococcales bacterium]
ATTASLVLIILAAARVWGLGLEREYIWATARTVVQLLLLGAVLNWVFDHASALLVLGVLLVFVGVASWTAVGRQSRSMPGLLWNVGISLTACAAVLTVLTSAFIIQVSPWWTPQYLIPLAGMIIANSMNTAALTIERLRSELTARRGEVEELLSLGAGARQAVDASARAALRAAWRPNLNSMLVVGLVSIPGTMTGQILTGLDPAGAARYQILVMVLWNAGATSSSALLVWLTYRRFFTPALQLRPELLEDPR